VWAVIEELQASVEQSRHALDVQFKRIAQLQTEVDELRRRLNGRT
jgi:hypothetical protein